MSPKKSGSYTVDELLVFQADLVRELSSISDLDLALARIMDVIIEFSGGKAVGIYIYHSETDEMRLRAYRGISEEFVAANLIAKNGTPEFEDMLGKSPIQKKAKRALAKEDLNSSGMFPIIHRNSLVATICMASKQTDSYPPEVIASIEVICQHLGAILSRIIVETELLESKLRLQAQYNNLPVPAYTWRQIDDNFILVATNPAARKFTQGGVDRIMGIKAVDFFIDRPDIVESLWKCYNERASFQLIYPFQFKTVEMMKHLRITFTFSEPDQITVYTEDITKERTALDKLQITNQQLRAEQQALKDKNIALQQVLQAIREKKSETGQEISANLETRILPLLKRLEEGAGEMEKKYIQLIRQGLTEITSPFVNNLAEHYRSLSPRELEICGYIIEGETTKQIARTMNVAVETVRTQRKSIRKKLEIKSEKVNLQTYLYTLAAKTNSSIDTNSHDRG